MGYKNTFGGAWTLKTLFRDAWIMKTILQGCTGNKSLCSPDITQLLPPVQVAMGWKCPSLVSASSSSLNAPSAL